MNSNIKQTKYFKLGFDVYVIVLNCQLENNLPLMRKILHMPFISHVLL